MQPETPAHPLHAMTTYELRDYRRDLEHRLTGMSRNLLPRDLLQRQLEAVLAEEDSRARLQQANGGRRTRLRLALPSVPEAG